ncbi:MAG: SDR family NAD(P)-dependent oxidoreductase, partial [Blastocatellia bacterium]
MRVFALSLSRAYRVNSLGERELVMNESFRDKRVIVTGASSGIGRATAERFLTESAHVALIGRREGS